MSYYSEEERDGQIITKVKPIVNKTSIGTNSFYLSKKGVKMLREAGMTEAELLDISDAAVNNALEQRRAQRAGQQKQRPASDPMSYYFGW